MSPGGYEVNTPGTYPLLLFLSLKDVDVELASLMLENQNHLLLRKGAAGPWETASAISNALQNCLLLNYFNLVSKTADDNHIQCRKQSMRFSTSI